MSSGSETLFSPIVRTAARQEAARQIREMILAGALHPGQALPSERELVAQLRVSRSVLREAIQTLVALNLLVTRQGAGTYVTSLDPALLMQPLHFAIQLNKSTLSSLFEARAVIESAAAGLAATRITDDQLSRLAEVTAGASAVVDDPEAFLLADYQIHDAVTAAAANPLLSHMCTAIATLSLDSRRLTAQSRSTRLLAREDHTRIVAALRSRDSAASRNAMASHLWRIGQAHGLKLSHFVDADADPLTLP